MADVEKLVLVGVGLLGGSIAKAALARGVASDVVGVGRNAQKLDRAVRAGTLTAATIDLAEACAGAELVVVCTPVDTIAEQVQNVAAACDRPTLITDAGSTKGNIVAALPGELPGGCRFVGSHPLAGSEKTGAANATEDLFVGRTVVVTPTEAVQSADVERLSAFWSALGATVRIMSPDEHDEALAATSHAPHLIAAALALATREKDLPLTASGWLDTTRIAAADAELWRPIFDANRANVLKALARFEKTMALLRRALEDESANELTKLLAEAKQVRDAAEEIRNANALGS